MLNLIKNLNQIVDGAKFDDEIKGSIVRDNSFGMNRGWNIFLIVIEKAQVIFLKKVGVYFKK